MSIELRKNIYGLSEGVFKACLFCGLKFPSEIKRTTEEHLPSDDFDFDLPTVRKIYEEADWISVVFEQKYIAFNNAYESQLCFSKYTKTDLNIFFCDYAIYSPKNFEAKNYFAFEFYRKSFELQSTFMPHSYIHDWRKVIFNHRYFERFIHNKVLTNKIFSEFLHRDWLDIRSSTFADFKDFVEKHTKFLSKARASSLGLGIEIVNIDSMEDLADVFADLKAKKVFVEEIVIQHEKIAEFCPDTVNTLRINTVRDIHGVVHIVATCGRFGRMGYAVDNWSQNGFAAVIDPKTGIIISDGFNRYSEKLQEHPDTGKRFKGFQYPCWNEICPTVKKMATTIPQMNDIGWDITVNNHNEVVLIEANQYPKVNIEQSPDFEGILNKFEPLIEETQDYKQREMEFLGYRSNIV